MGAESTIVWPLIWISRLGVVVLVSLLGLSSVSAARISDFRPYEYDLRFTNPKCRVYPYSRPVRAQAGDLLKTKPPGAFCTHSDASSSGGQLESPMRKLKEWISDPSIDEVFFAFLSFSNREVGQALCRAIQVRDLKVTFVLDSGTDQGAAQELLKCRPRSGRADRQPVMHLRGNQKGMGYAHNKVVLAYPKNHLFVRIAFGSGNLSSGVVLHHENWHFITTNPETHFAKSHECLKNAMIEAGNSKGEYSTSLRNCRASIRVPEEDDIKTFFVPGEGTQAFKVLSEAVNASSRILIAAHRFSFPELMKSLQARLQSGRSSRSVDMRLVVDDDVWWVGHGEKTGANESMEYANVVRLREAGLQVRYVETNHWAQLFQHNKFLVFSDARGGGAVFTGAGNLTRAAFTDNMENFYFIRIPAVVEEFQAQYRHLWDNLATPEARLPLKNVQPRM